MERPQLSTMFKFIIPALALATPLFFNSCDTEDPDPVKEQELITTVELTFQKTGVNEDPVTFTWRDVDGSGPGAPVIDEIVLDAHSEYTFTVRLLNESVSPAENITEEVEEEDEEHQFFFTTSGVDGVVMTYNDADSNGKPVGIQNTIVTDHAGTGLLKVILIHEPKKDATGVAAGNPANAGGETDVETEFVLEIVE